MKLMERLQRVRRTAKSDTRQVGATGDERPAVFGESHPAERLDEKRAVRQRTHAPRGPRTPRPRRSFRYRAIRFLLVGATLSVATLVAAVVLLVAIYSYLAEDPLKAGLGQNPAKVTILADNGEVITEQGLRRQHVKVSEMPPHLIDAVLATEDRRFYYHFGFDPIGIVRAVVANYRAGRIVEGGSTITQQLTKVLFLEPARTYQRKMEEVLLALWLEWRLEKSEILELYLNRIYFGAGNYGIEAAAQHYFGKPVSDIDIYESAILAGMIRAPSFFAPTRDLERARERGRVVLRVMLEGSYITQAQYDTALDNPPELRAYLPSQSYGYVIDWVIQLVADFRQTLQSDIVVQTTIDYQLQGAAQKILTQAMDAQAESYQAGQAAAVILDMKGAVKALVGGRDYTASQFNRVVQARRQPGSAFKPLVFLAGLENGLTPESLVHDGPIQVGDWAPRNFNDRYAGDVSLREGLAKSMNTVAVRVSEWVGHQRVIETAHRLGITTALEVNPSLSLGTTELTMLELAGAYVPFANGGFLARPHIIAAINDAEGRVLYQQEGTNVDRVIRAQHVAAMNNMLTATIREGTGRQATLESHPAAGKTGTSQSYRDAWFVGYTAHYVTGVWMGNDDSSPMGRVTGGSLPTQIWHSLMVQAHLTKPPVALPGGTWSEETAQATRPRRRQSFWDAIFGTQETAPPSLGAPPGTARSGRDSGRESDDQWRRDAFSN